MSENGIYENENVNTDDLPVIEKCKVDSGLSYSHIAELSEVGLTATFRAIKTPWRTSLKTLMKVMEPILNRLSDMEKPISTYIIEKAWNEEKKKYYNRLYSN